MLVNNKLIALIVIALFSIPISPNFCLGLSIEYTNNNSKNITVANENGSFSIFKNDFQVGYIPSQNNTNFPDKNDEISLNTTINNMVYARPELKNYLPSLIDKTPYEKYLFLQKIDNLLLYQNNGMIENRTQAIEKELTSTNITEKNFSLDEKKNYTKKIYTTDNQKLNENNSINLNSAGFSLLQN